MTVPGAPLPAVRCVVCGQPAAEPLRVSSLRDELVAEIRRRAPAAPDDAQICVSCRTAVRMHQVLERLEEDRGALSEVEADIARKAATHEAVAGHVGDRFEQSMTFGQRLADQVARVGGSWTFVLSFMLCLAGWIAFNSLVLRGGAFDPYPYILLNLGLSCVAALQAPIIMMAQNRVAQRDRAQADEDFRVNLKAELEVSSLHEKLDHLLHAKWQRLVDLQELQIDLLRQLRGEHRDDPS